MWNRLYKRRYYGWWLLLLLNIVSCSGKKRSVLNFIADPDNGLMQVKNTGHQTIAIEILPETASLQKSKNGETDFYKVKLVLRSNEKIAGPAAMQYMNFGIKNSFYAVQDADTLPCVICERIPGINDREYIYMALFNKPAAAITQGTILRLYVTDTTAGFGPTVFLIKNEALKKLEAIEQ